MLQMEQQLIELSIQRDDETAAYERQLSQARQQLAAQIEQWSYQYMITSPVAGKITYTNYWSTNQTIRSGERLATVIPAESMQVIGRLTVPTANFGKVALGQTVNIKLSGYPYMEYGLLKGSIASISEVPEAGGYIAEVTLPDSLKTTYGKPLALIRQMDGTGEIITVDQRLIQRFLQPIRALFDK
jgi:multidrug resistance efflux pump